LVNKNTKSQQNTTNKKKKKAGGGERETAKKKKKKKSSSALLPLRAAAKLQVVFKQKKLNIFTCGCLYKLSFIKNK